MEATQNWGVPPGWGLEGGISRRGAYLSSALGKKDGKQAS